MLTKKSNLTEKTLLICALLSLSLLVNFKSFSQIVPSSNPDVYLDMHVNCDPCTTDIVPADIETLNCDVVDQAQYKLWAVAYDLTDVGRKDLASGCFFYDPTPKPTCGFHIEYMGPFNFPSLNGKDRCYRQGSKKPDIVIANDLSTNRWQEFLVMSVYENSGDVELVSCPATNVCGACISPTLGTLSTPVVLNDVTNGRHARDIHIDLFGDKNDWAYNIGPDFIKALHTYVAVWTEDDYNTGTSYLMAAVGDVANPGVFSRYQITPNNPGDPEARISDVAAMGWFKTNASGQVGTAYITFAHPTSPTLYVAELNLMSWGSVSPAVAPTATVGTITTIAAAPNHNAVEVPRIECKALGNVVPGEATWTVAASVVPWGGSNFEIRTYNDAITTPNITTFNSPYNNWRPVVTGTGEDMDPSASGRVGETQFSIGYYSDYNGLNANGDYFANSVDIAGGTITNTNTYQINNTPLSQSFGIGSPLNAPMAMATSTNTGDDLFSVWYAGWDISMNWGYLYYKFAGNGYGFKTTTIGNLTPEQSSGIHPNPVKDVLFVDNAANSQYTVLNTLGAVVLKGKIDNKSNSIDVSSLAAGSYFIHLLDDNGVRNSKFIKE